MRLRETWGLTRSFRVDVLGICCAQDNNPSGESTNQAETDVAGDVSKMTRTEKQYRKAINTVFNEVRQRAYVLGAREREILLIQQSI